MIPYSTAAGAVETAMTLKTLHDWNHDPTPIPLRLTTPKQRHKFMNDIKTIHTAVLDDLPPPGLCTWDGCYTRSKLIDAAVDAISPAGGVFCEEDDFREYSRTFLTRIVDICRILDEWTDVQDTRTRPDGLTPRQLSEKVESSCSRLMRTWFSRMMPEGKSAPGWQVAKEIAVEWIALVHGQPHSIFPYVELNVLQSS